MGVLLSNCTFTEGKVTHTCRQPFDTFALIAAQAEKGKPPVVPGQAKQGGGVADGTRTRDLEIHNLAL